MKTDFYIGKKYNLFTIIIFVGYDKFKRRVFNCKCECGKEKEVAIQALKSGNTKSCGCIGTNNTHNMTNTKMYAIWKAMKTRCSNKKDRVFSSYGGRGIKVYSKWRCDFEEFYQWAMNNGYSEKLTIDRIDNDGNYEPSNCRFVDRSTQAANRRAYGKNKYVGIYYSEEKKIYYAKINYKGKNILNKTFKTELEALYYRNDFIIKNNMPHQIQGEK